MLSCRYGKKLKDFCREQRNIRTDIDEIALILEGILLKTEVQLETLQTLLKSDSLQPALWAHYLRALRQLESKMSGALSGLESVNRRRLNQSGSKFPLGAKTVYLKRDLQELVNCLEEWQRRFDPSWYLITLVSRPVVDKQLQNQQTTPESPAAKLSRLREAVHWVSKNLESSANASVFKVQSVLHNERQQIPYTSTYLARYLHDGREVILDHTNYRREATAIANRSQLRDLARLLRNVEPLEFGLLKCEGIIEVGGDQGTQYEFIFGVPSGLHTMRTLRSLFFEEPQCSLTKRVQLAKQLARSVMFVHNIGFVHKGIRPETILVCGQGNEGIGPSFLIGFERIRRAEAQTDFLGDLEWDRNLYRHPVRQGLWSEEAFSMQHDIYSLGVCLLEIALWQSFVQIGDAFKSPWADMEIEEAIADKDARRGGYTIKKKLVTMAEGRLPRLVGDRYTNLVVACLCCLDQGEKNIFNGEGCIVKDSDGVIIGVRFIEHVSTFRTYWPEKCTSLTRSRCSSRWRNC